jgi:F-type H+-transporting ATPase subunit b
MSDIEAQAPMESAETQAVIEVSPPHAGAHAEDPAQSLMKVNFQLMGLTWLAFGVVAFLLGRFAWKPLMKALDLREKSIRHALDDAEKARQEAERLDKQAKAVIAEAEGRSREMMESAKAAAAALAERVNKQAREQADALLAAARQEMQTELAKARQTLRDECATLSIAIATKLVAANMDSEKNRQMVDRLLQENRAQ